MISGFTLIPFFCTSAAASKTARACISEISGNDNPRRQPRMTEHRVELVQFVDALRDLVRAHADLLRQIVLGCVIVRQEFVQRRIEETNRRRKAFQFFEDADEIAPSDTAAISPALFSGRRRLRARIISRMASMRSPSKNMCSVRHRPMPVAPNATALAVCSACRRWCAPAAASLSRTNPSTSLKF